MTQTPQRRTRQRTAVAEALDGLAEFRTAQDIHDLLRHAGESIGLATVYRSLQSMAEAGEADVIRTPDGQAAYRSCGQGTGHHHHLICRSCGRTVEFELDDFESLVGTIAARHAFIDVDHELELFGTCAACAAS
ncbi:Fur family transcriptional regulator [Propioniciclava soli]|uniref:Transcriptional repressor n=1 Tax=Propioniciclava soli TaxID=2775081 RepID=A0ABZ3CE53_9ACTN|nr:transcriptional repressor [Propioniciclava soli]